MYLKNIALGRMADPEDIGRVIVFLLSEEARYITSSVLRPSNSRLSQLLIIVLGHQCRWRLPVMWQD